MCLMYIKYLLLHEFPKNLGYYSSEGRELRPEKQPTSLAHLQEMNMYISYTHLMRSKYSLLGARRN